MESAPHGYIHWLYKPDSVFYTYKHTTQETNLVPRACDPWEGNEGSGIIRFREESDWPLK